MSVQAMVWVFGFSKSEGLSKLVLLSLANRSTSRDGRAGRRARRFASDCGIHPSTVKRCLDDLVNLGEVFYRREASRIRAARVEFLPASGCGEVALGGAHTAP